MSWDATYNDFWVLDNRIINELNCGHNVATVVNIQCHAHIIRLHHSLVALWCPCQSFTIVAMAHVLHLCVNRAAI